MKVRDEDGQVLLLAMGFLFFFGLVIGALLTFASASMLGTARLREQRATVYAADGAVDAAIQAARSDSGAGAYGDVRCRASNPSSSTPPVFLTTAATSVSPAATVICAWSPDPLQPDRTVTFTSFVAGTAKPIVRATVTYHDSGGGVPPVNIVSWTYCAHDAGACP